jgi:hypothetical protein
MEIIPMERRRFFPVSLEYFLLGILLWVIVDWGTAGGFRPAYLEQFGPSLLVFYAGYPAVFTILIFVFHGRDGNLFLATLAAVFIIEVVFTGNSWLTVFPQCVIGIPLSVMVYAPLTFFPLWVVRGETGRRKCIMGALTAVEITVILLTVFGAP